ncbi:MAG: heparinase II/III family protein [Actinobacteria bacterium]|nr:heparinase II/III family protein [Actinomycetota bacterium]
MRVIRVAVGTALLVFGVASTSLVGMVAPSRTEAAAQRETVPAGCAEIPRIAARWQADISQVASERRVRFDGRWVSLSPQGWRDAYNADVIRNSSWALWFQALVWVVPLALENAPLAVRTVVDQANAVPDPGTSASPATQVATGWTPGAIRNRLITVRCLYLMTRDDRLVAVARELGDALMDPKRYSGWPRSLPHNHGALTSLAMIRAAKTFARPQWTSVSLERLERDLPKVFSACGMAREQSSGYQALNVSLWSEVANLLDYKLSGPRYALRALARPDGVLEHIGDGLPPAVEPNGQRLWCPRAGWAANTLPGRTHYVLRFGPKASLHGHSDHGAVTWFVQDIPVLSDRGLYDKTVNDRLAYARGMAAHSVLEPLNVTINPATEAKRLDDNEYRLVDDTFGIRRERTIKIAPRGIAVTDIASSGNPGQEWVQHWQLAPGWTPTDDGAVYTDGTRLVVTCRGGTLTAVAVESYPNWRQIQPAWDLQCRATGSAVRLRTTLEVK